MSPFTSCWSDLPELPLLSIAGRLLSVRDLAAFYSVCRRWRRLSSPLLLPPLLLDPRISLLETITLPTLLYKAHLPPRNLSLLASSHGRLIFLDAPPRITVADPFAGTQIQSPLLPDATSPDYGYASLTAVPSSPDSVLLLFPSRVSSEFLYLPIGLRQPHWSTCRLLDCDGVRVAHAASFKNRLLAINDTADKLLEFDLGEVGEVTARVSNVSSGALPPGLIFDRTHFGPRLVECGRDLLLLLFVQDKENGDVTQVDCYKMDFEAMAWVEAKWLWDYALFVDCAGKFAVACYRPQRWREMGGCVYVAGPGCETFIQLPVGGCRKIPHWGGKSSVSAEFMTAPKWPSSIWAYPSLFF